MIPYLTPIELAQLMLPGWGQLVTSTKSFSTARSLKLSACLRTALERSTGRIQKASFRRLTERILQVICPPRSYDGLAIVNDRLEPDLPRPPSHSMLDRNLLVNDLRYFRVWDVPPEGRKTDTTLIRGGRGERWRCPNDISAMLAQLAIFLPSTVD